MKVRNNEPRLICLPFDINLVPGVNEVPDAVWAQLSAPQKMKNGTETSYVADFLVTPAQGQRGLMTLEVVASGEPMIPKNAALTLKDLNEDDAISMVEDAEESQIAIWATDEKRPKVVIAVKQRLAALAKAK